MNKEEQAIWKDMFSKGNSFKEIADYIELHRSRQKSPFDFEDIMKNVKKNSSDTDEMLNDFMKGMKGKPKKKK